MITLHSQRMTETHESTPLDIRSALQELQQQEGVPVLGYRQKTLYHAHGVTIFLMVLEQGTTLSQRTVDGVASVHVLEGQTDVRVGSQVYSLGAGRLVRVPHGEQHTIRSMQRTTLLLTVHRQTPSALSN